MGRGWSRGDVHEKEVRGRIRRCRLSGLVRWRAHRLPVPVNRPTDGPTQPKAMRRADVGWREVSEGSCESLVLWGDNSLQLT